MVLASHPEGLQQYGNHDAKKIQVKDLHVGANQHGNELGYLWQALHIPVAGESGYLQCKAAVPHRIAGPEIIKPPQLTT